MAYLAGVLDTQAIIRTRLTAGGTELPYVGLSSPNGPLLRLLAAATGTRVTVTRRSYGKAGCAEHCPDKHLHVESLSGRWSVSGLKATVLLFNVRPHLHLQLAAADDALQVGLTAPFKAATVSKMKVLGFEIPEFG